MLSKHESQEQKLCFQRRSHAHWDFSSHATFITRKKKIEIYIYHTDTHRAKPSDCRLALRYLYHSISQLLFIEPVSKKGGYCRIITPQGGTAEDSFRHNLRILIMRMATAFVNVKLSSCGMHFYTHFSSGDSCWQGSARLVIHTMADFRCFHLDEWQHFIFPRQQRLAVYLKVSEQQTLPFYNKQGFPLNLLTLQCRVYRIHTFSASSLQGCVI